jgi:hypothetical protein
MGVCEWFEDLKMEGKAIRNMKEADKLVCATA